MFTLHGHKHMSVQLYRNNYMMLAGDYKSPRAAARVPRGCERSKKNNVKSAEN